MLTALAVITILALSATAALYLADLFGERERTRELSSIGIQTSAALCTVTVVTIALDQGPAAIARVPNVFASLAFLVTVGFIAVRTSFEIRSAGALVAPASAIAMLIYLLQQQASVTEDHGSGGFLLAVHVGLALIGLGAFALAAFLAVLYLVQERQLRRKQFGRLFRRLPSLQELEVASFRLIALGFLIYTVALVLGMVWAATIHQGGWNARTIFAYVAWVIFAAVLYFRAVKGWRGRQSAILTVAGCVSATVVLLLYGLGG